MACHVTNGDRAVIALQQVGFPKRDILPWRDILHEGSLPSDDDTLSFARARARFIASQGWGREEEILQQFCERDSSLARALAGSGEIVLWFESDLYDQLQLLQILARIGRDHPQRSRVSLAAVADLDPELRWIALSELPVESLLRAYQNRNEITAAAFAEAGEIWRLIVGGDIPSLDAVRISGAPVLRDVPSALRRFLAELPGIGDGLSQTERTVLSVLATGECDVGTLFRSLQQREERPFLGDLSCVRILNVLSRGSHPLVQPRAGDRVVWSITEAGSRKLAGGEPIRVPSAPRYLGGYLIDETGGSYRWDDQARRVALAGAER